MVDFWGEELRPGLPILVNYVEGYEAFITVGLILECSGDTLTYISWVSMKKSKPELGEYFATTLPGHRVSRNVIIFKSPLFHVNDSKVAEFLEVVDFVFDHELAPQGGRPYLDGISREDILGHS